MLITLKPKNSLQAAQNVLAGRVFETLVIEKVIGKDGEDAFVNQNFCEKDKTNNFSIESAKNCKWTKIIKKPKAVEFQKQHLLGKLCKRYDLSLYDIFLQVSDFYSLLKKIVIPESIRYAHQEGRTYDGEDEAIKAFIGLNLFMGYIAYLHFTYIGALIHNLLFLLLQIA